MWIQAIRVISNFFVFFTRRFWANKKQTGKQKANKKQTSKQKIKKAGFLCAYKHLRGGKSFICVLHFFVRSKSSRKKKIKKFEIILIPSINITTQVCNFIKKESLAQVFSCEFCKISKNTFPYRTPPVAASVFFMSRSAISRTLYWRSIFYTIKKLGSLFY